MTKKSVLKDAGETETFCFLRWYLTLQGDNSVKSAKRFNYVVLLREYYSFSMIKINVCQTVI